MCGIIGLFSKSLNEKKIKKITKLGDLLAHRGPDETGIYKNQKICFIHKRLSIVDLSGGSQPIKNQEYVLIANGEIYNDLELRDSFKDFNYKTKSDSESIIAVYKKFGIDGFKKLRGMFSFAIFDIKKSELILCRDPFGIKPMYFFKDNENFMFSSEISPIIQSGFVKKKLNAKKINELLQIQFNSGRKTIFNNITRLRPGEILKIKDNKIIKSHILELKNNNKNVKINEKKLKEKLLESVNLHQRSDVPYGVFFSGGIDSTTVLYFMSLINKKPIQAFTIIFKGMEKYNDNLNLLANRFGAKLRSIEFSENDLWDILPNAVKFMDDPVSDYAILPTYKLASEAKKYVKVVLTGEGGDELFGGYGRYRSNYRRLLRKGFLEYGLLNDYLNSNSNLANWGYDLSFTRLKINNSDLTNLQKKQMLDYNEWLPNNILIKLDRCLMAHSLEGRTPLVDSKLFNDFFLMKDNMKIKNNLGKYCLRSLLKKEVSIYDSFLKKKGFTVPIYDWIPKKSKLLSHLLSKNKILYEFIKPSQIKKICMNCANNKKATTIVWRLLFFSIWFLVHHENVKVEGNSFDMLEKYN